MSRSCRSDGASVIGASAAVLGVFSICALAACGWISDESPRCLAGESRLCHCASGAAGRQVCLEDGRSLGPCECEAAGTPEGVEELASGTAPTPAADESTTPGPAVALAAAAPPSPAGSALSAPPGVDAATLGLWRFDEGSGETAADSGPRALSGAVLGASWTDGRFGKALLLDGTTSHVRLPASTEIRPLGPFTIEAWVRPESSREMEVVSLAEALGLSLRPRDAAVEAVFQIPLGGQPQVLVSSEPLALFAFHPFDTDAPTGEDLDAIPVLYYRVFFPSCGGPNVGDPNRCDYRGFTMCDIWTGGAFLQAGASQAVALLGLKGLGGNCYDEPPVQCQDPCSDHHGYHCHPYERQVIFYDVEELGRAAQGGVDPWTIAPYTIWRPRELLLSGHTCGDVGGMTFDPSTRRVFMIERGLGGPSENQAAVHVWTITE